MRKSKQRQISKKRMSKEKREAVELVAKGLRIVEEIKGMGISEKRKRKREEETVEQWEKRMIDVQAEAVKTGIEYLIER